MRTVRLLVIPVVALIGCDSLQTAKDEKPVVGDPPPRIAAAERPSPTWSARSASRKSTRGADHPAGGARPHSERTATKDVAQASSDAAWHPALSRGTEHSDPAGETVVPINFANRDPRTAGDASPSSPLQAERKVGGAEVVATVNGAPIFASEVLEQYEAKLHEAKTQMSPVEFQRLREMLIRRDLKGHIEQKLLVQALRETLKEEQLQAFNKYLDQAFDEEAERMKKELGVHSKVELERELQKQGTSLAKLREAFVSRRMAIEYMGAKANPKQNLGRQELLDYYKAHADDYAVPARVRWQQIVIDYAKHGGKQAAFRVLEKAVDELYQGADFGDVARRDSDGPLAKKGGQWDWTQAGSLSSQKIEAVLFKIPLDTISEVIEEENAYYLVKVNDREPAGRTPFENVQQEIQAKLVEQARRNASRKLIEDLYKNAVIETVFEDANPVLSGQ